jgi:hypothetical protein
VKSGKGFHSNDTKVVTANEGKEILPAAYGTDVGVILKPDKKIIANNSSMVSSSKPGIYICGDDGNIEPGGKTRREGIDLIARYQFTKNLFGNLNLNVTRPRAIVLLKKKIIFHSPRFLPVLVAYFISQ